MSWKFKYLNQLKEGYPVFVGKKKSQHIKDYFEKQGYEVEIVPVSGKQYKVSVKGIRKNKPNNIK